MRVNNDFLNNVVYRYSTADAVYVWRGFGLVLETTVMYICQWSSNIRRALNLNPERRQKRCDKLNANMMGEAAAV